MTVIYVLQGKGQFKPKLVKAYIKELSLFKPKATPVLFTAQYQ